MEAPVEQEYFIASYFPVIYTLPQTVANTEKILHTLCVEGGWWREGERRGGREEKNEDSGERYF
jgi:hypothetical protein